MRGGIAAGWGGKVRAQTMGPAHTLTYRCTSKESKKCNGPHSAGHVKDQALAEQFAEIVARLTLPEDWLARLDELVNVGGGAGDGNRRALKERLARLKKPCRRSAVAVRAWGGERRE